MLEFLRRKFSRVNWQAASSAPSSVPPRRAEVGRMLGSWSCQFPSLSTRQDWQSETSGARQVLFRGRSGLAMHTTSAWAAGGHLCRRPPRWNAELGRHLQRQAAAGSLQRNKLWVPASLFQAKLGLRNHASKEHGVWCSAQLL